MKKIVLSLLISLMATVGFSQEQEQPKGGERPEMGEHQRGGHRGGEKMGGRHQRGGEGKEAVGEKGERPRPERAGEGRKPMGEKMGEGKRPHRPEMGEGGREAPGGLRPPHKGGKRPIKVEGEEITIKIVA